MKISSGVLLLMASMAFVLIGCSDNSMPVAASPDMAVSTAPSAGSLAKGVTLHSATGSSQYMYSMGTRFNWKMSFTASQIVSGSSAAKGEVQGSGDVGDLKFHGTLLDLKVDHENTWAKLSWTFTSGPWVGQYGIILVIDNGEGNNAAAPDMTSWLLYAQGNEPELGGTTIQELIDMSPTEFLAWTGVPPDVFLIPDDNANIQIR